MMMMMMMTVMLINYRWNIKSSRNVVITISITAGCGSLNRNRPRLVTQVCR